MKPVDAVMTIESGTATKEEYIAAFQYLLDEGTVWELQGFYGRTAKALLEAGLITENKK